ncbi:MAG: D-Ala-D-Ala carboxypeptidase family metallohydrolase [Desulfobulbaceae bacterium]|nr:D-Ala-D-Ala carboxypeptidase family metallohydrolase [Desulfobulbaceae bacterium]
MKKEKTFNLLLLIILSHMQLLLAATAFGYHPGEMFSANKIDFTVKVKDDLISYNVFSLFIGPEETVSVEVLDKKNRAASCRFPDGVINHQSSNVWQWRAPRKPGHYPVAISVGSPENSMTLNVFVMVPFADLKGEYLNGYRIGKYPLPSRKKAKLYEHPAGFIEITKENENVYISPHFKLKQFLCKQQSAYPKYLVLRERLLMKLEILLEEVNVRGHHCNTLTIMSGYRTPFYNKAIGNVAYSRHILGDAADIYIDEHPCDGLMDDLNGDGKIDHKDSKVSYNIVEKIFGKPSYKKYIGGLGLYKATTTHGPFVHVDTRGVKARWGI